MSFTFENWIPSVTLRQIYSTDTFYAQLYEKIGISGVSAGFAASKTLELSDRISYKCLLKSNFSQFNWEDLLTFGITPNLDWDFKIVDSSVIEENLGKLGWIVSTRVLHETQIQDHRQQFQVVDGGILQV